MNEHSYKGAQNVHIKLNKMKMKNKNKQQQQKTANLQRQEHKTGRSTGLQTACARVPPTPQD